MRRSVQVVPAVSSRIISTRSRMYPVDTLAAAFFGESIYTNTALSNLLSQNEKSEASATNISDTNSIITA